MTSSECRTSKPPRDNCFVKARCALLLSRNSGSLCQRREWAQMTYSAVVFEDDADVARAAQYTRVSERLVEVIQVLEPVEQGHDQCRFADSGADCLNRCIEAIGLGTQNDNVEGACDFVLRDRCDGRAEIAERTFDLETIAHELFAPLRPHEKGHVDACLGQQAAEVSACGAGPKN